MATYTQTNVFSNGTTADGGQVNTEVVNLGTSINSLYSTLGTGVNLGVFTPWATWSPTTTLGGDMTSSGTTINKARWTQIGKVVYFQLDCTVGITANTTGKTIGFSLPVTSASALGGGGAGMFVSSSQLTGCWVFGTTTRIDISRYDYAVFTVASTEVQVNGLFEVA